jgi:glycogen debranching enzyme
MKLRAVVIAGLMLGSVGVGAQEMKPLHAIAELPLRMDGPVLRRSVRAGEPFTVAGMQGVIVGQQQGLSEIWLLPVKLLSHMTVEAEVQGYPVPLDLNSMAREIEVRPDRTTITYSHIAVTVKQTMFAPEDAPMGTGAVVLFEVDAVRPVTLTVSFTAEMREMWPKPSSGTPSAEWVAEAAAPGSGASASGFYVLHTDFAEMAAAVALPGAVSGVMAPYQERPQVHPLEFVLHVDPAKERHVMFPMLMAMGRTKETATNAALRERLAELDEGLPKMYAQHVAAVEKKETELTRIVTPDEGLNADLAWAEVSIGQLQARTAPTAEEPKGEVGLVAGYYASGDSARPGFGWYFGRDALYTLYAVDSYGDFGLVRRELEFLLRRQRADGKVMHEFSQTAGEMDWGSLPYEYAAADATPLMLMTMRDYVKASGDVGFVQAHKDAVMKAWRFECGHDSDGDGIYDNAQGTGWVESWPGGMPKQEIYLALLDEQASRAMAGLAEMLGETQVADEAAVRAAKVKATLEREYYRGDADAYAFSRNAGGVMDDAATMFPMVAWWDEGGGLEHAGKSLRRWASHDFDTDWGMRDVAESDTVYDPISYHQGSVWPLFTGWAAMAEYRAGQPVAGYQALMQNADLTYAQDPGAVTELLSGAFYEPFGRSTSHQLWSSAMVVTPLLRGMFGIEVDAVKHEVKVTPRLPGDWPGAQVQRLHVGASVVDVNYKREGGAMVVTLTQVSGPEVRLGSEARVKLPAVEVSVAHGLPERGARTAQMKVMQTTYEGRSLRLELEGVGGSTSELRVTKNEAVTVKAEGATLEGDALRVTFVGDGYQTQVVTLRW